VHHDIPWENARLELPHCKFNKTDRKRGKGRGEREYQKEQVDSEEKRGRAEGVWHEMMNQS
jgi:hypothetical protein